MSIVCYVDNMLILCCIDTMLISLADVTDLPVTTLISGGNSMIGSKWGSNDVSWCEPASDFTGEGGTTLAAVSWDATTIKDGTHILYQAKTVSLQAKTQYLSVSPALCHKNPV